MIDSPEGFTSDPPRVCVAGRTERNCGLFQVFFREEGVLAPALCLVIVLFSCAIFRM
jgi:hypothetical protein